MLVKPEQANFYQEVGALIKKARLVANLKQEYIANRLGLTRTSIVNIEKGEQKIQLHTLLELVNILNMNVNDFLPNIDNYINTNLNKEAEKEISKAVKQINNPQEASEILRTFIKYSQKK